MSMSMSNRTPERSGAVGDNPNVRRTVSLKCESEANPARHRGPVEPGAVVEVPGLRLQLRPEPTDPDVYAAVGEYWRHGGPDVIEPQVNSICLRPLPMRPCSADRSWG